MKKFLLTLFGITLLVSGYLVIHWFQQYRAANERRYYIFCEQLQEGMSKTEVLTVLKKYGNFEYGESSWGENLSEIFGTYRNPPIVGESTIYLVFHDHKYSGAHTRRFDNIKPVCNSQ